MWGGLRVFSQGHSYCTAFLWRSNHFLHVVLLELWSKLFAPNPISPSGGRVGKDRCTGEDQGGAGEVEGRKGMQRKMPSFLLFF